MISIISINNSKNNTIITTTTTTPSGESTAKVPQILENIPPEVVVKGHQNNTNNNNNDNCDNNYDNNRKNIDNKRYATSVPVQLHNKHSSGSGRVGHDIVHHGQLVLNHTTGAHHHTTGADEYDVDEGFNEDSASSITSNNSSVTTVVVPSPPPQYPPPPLPTDNPHDVDTPAAIDSPLQSPNLVQKHSPSPVVVQALTKTNGKTSGSDAKKFNTVRNRIQCYMELTKIANTSKADLQRDYEKEEQNQCVLYITSMGIIRKTYEKCRQLKAILCQHLIRFDERDIYINPNFKTELIERTNGDYELPVLYINGKSIGNLEVVERLNECGQLIHLLSDFRLSANVAKVCDCCGGTKFIPCQVCNGSTKSQVHHFVSDSISLKCSQCRRSGLQKCPKCYLKAAIHSMDSTGAAVVESH